MGFIKTLSLMGIMLPLVAWGAKKAPVAFQVDEVHSFILFKVSHLGFSNTYGRFTKVAGTFEIYEEDMEQSKMTVKIPVSSLNTHDAKRDKHLKGPDFFNAKQFPEINFVSRRLSKKGPKTYQLTGVLTLHGQSKEIVGDLEFMRMGKDPRGTMRMGGEARFVINRKDFQMNYMTGTNGIGEEVEIIASFEGIKKESKK